jgi:phage tail-like protein
MSSYLQYLPEIYRDSDFTGRFLKIFEKILTGIDNEVAPDQVIPGEVQAYLEQPGIEQTLDMMKDYFDPTVVPLEFLDWLAGWVALELPGDWHENTKRELIRRIVPLYSTRGTLQGLEEFLRIYAGPGVTINEWLSPFQIGVSSTLGKDTALGSGPPGFFTVKVVLPEPDLEKKIEKEKVVRAIIDREKPAHTYYQLDVIIPTMQIGVHSTIRLDTLLG